MGKKVMLVDDKISIDGQFFVWNDVVGGRKTLPKREKFPSPASSGYSPEDPSSS